MFMKALLLLAVVAVASAQLIARSSTFHGNGYAAGYALPYAYSAYGAYSPLAVSAYSAPVAYASLPGYGVHPY
ncbi:hypothetical protein ONE63_000749 [Megalurothrips usitatus]|uniref:Uncharacterized protein n=1 Tax=Megalurothrips usitatus TaxID=439358 RepID=A0AAV7Y373_9NEOP|nr:hypothetical protein ONE63_000749 [Megalurothrips usitatus]